MSNIYIISVCNNNTIYNRVIGNNPYLANCHITKYDNSQENLPIPTRYNHYIEYELNGQEGWLIFCHQDFQFLEDPASVLARLDPNSIYGPIGIYAPKYRTFLIQFGGQHWIHTHRRKEIRPVLCGQILQGEDRQTLSLGKRLKYPQEVDTVDCCCLIVHSSLIKRFNLRFDSQFDFHLYSEDFSLAARKHGIKTYACQIKCRHMSPGNANESFWIKYQALLKKYPNEFFLTTCAGVKQYFYHSLAAHWDIFPQELYDLYS